MQQLKMQPRLVVWNPCGVVRATTQILVSAYKENVRNSSPVLVQTQCQSSKETQSVIGGGK